MILAQLTLIICWYNPAAWILRKDLKLNHEYQADQYSLDSGCDTKSYQMFLLQRVAGKNFPVLANNLNIKNLKQRIAMINRNRSNGVSNILLLWISSGSHGDSGYGHTESERPRDTVHIASCVKNGKRKTNHP